MGRRKRKCQVLGNGTQRAKKRGVEDIFIVCTDNLTGFSAAIGAVFPKTEIQNCIIHQQRHNYNQRRNDETVNHGADGSLGAAHQLRRDRKDARHDGHGQKTQNEPGEDLLDGELSFKRTAVLLESHGFLTLQVQLHKGEHDHRGDDRQRAGQLDHGGEIACRLGEGIAGGHHGGGVVHRRTCPDAKGLIRHTQCPAHDGKQHDHRHVK